VLFRSAAGASHSLARRADGTAYAWGSNGSGQLCLGSTTTQVSPQVISLSGVVGVYAGSGSHSLLATATGGLYGCGNNWSGQLGHGTYDAGSTSPTAVTAVW
jgi:alpha-tubulin suppressor-like RCC1 family protein